MSKNAGKRETQKKETGAVVWTETTLPVWVGKTNISTRYNPVEMLILLIGLGNIPARADFTVVDAQIKSAVGVIANPCFIHDGCPLAPVIRQR